MSSENQINLDIALRKFHELALADGTWVMNIGTGLVSCSSGRPACSQRLMRCRESSKHAVRSSSARRSREGIRWAPGHRYGFLGLVGNLASTNPLICFRSAFVNRPQAKTTLARSSSSQ